MVCVTISGKSQTRLLDMQTRGFGGGGLESVDEIIGGIRGTADI